jgi:hypothetical protein
MLADGSERHSPCAWYDQNGNAVHDNTVASTWESIQAQQRQKAAWVEQAKREQAVAEVAEVRAVPKIGAKSRRMASTTKICTDGSLAGKSAKGAAGVANRSHSWLATRQVVRTVKQSPGM